jgi:disulfide bond formation protein DsbB
MQPCPWCVLQRLVFLLIAAVALAGWVAAALVRTPRGRPSPPARAAGVGVVLLSAGGIAAALWQHFVAAASTSCTLTLADRIVAATGLDQRLPEVFVAYASCAEAKVNLLGLPYEFWSLALFALMGAAGLALLRRPR